jgi:hypothetical protein
MSRSIVCVDALYSSEDLQAAKIVYNCFSLPQFNYTYTIEDTKETSVGPAHILYEFPEVNFKTGERIAFRASRFADLEVQEEEIDEEVIEQLLYEMFKNDPNGRA